MLKIVIPATECWDEVKQEFVYTKTQELQLEHSLVSLSKWESKYGKPFLTKQDKTLEETIFYIKCMTMTQNVDENIYNLLTAKNIDQVNEYIEAPMTATQLPTTKGGKKNPEIPTAELIYFWMISFNIPFECQKWHLNRLITLIQVCNIKNQSPKKETNREILSRNAALNAIRRKQLNTRG